MGQDAVAITDHGRIASVIPFVVSCRESEIKPIIGSEVYIASGSMVDKAISSGDNFHLTLIAQTKTGYKNLVRLTSEAHTRGYSFRPRMDLELLFQYNEGLILLTGCIGAQLPWTITYRGMKEAKKLLELYQMQFPDRVFVELMYHGNYGGLDHTRIEDEGGKILIEEGNLNDALIDLARSCSIPIVATNDAHYLHERDGDHHDTLICKGKNKFDASRTFRFPGAEHEHWEFYVKSEKEMLKIGKGKWGNVWTEAVHQAAEIASMIESDIVPMGQQIIPPFQIPKDEGFEHWRKTGLLITNT